MLLHERLTQQQNSADLCFVSLWLELYVAANQIVQCSETKNIRNHTTYYNCNYNVNLGNMGYFPYAFLNSHNVCTGTRNLQPIQLVCYIIIITLINAHTAWFFILFLDPYKLPLSWLLNCVVACLVWKSICL